MREGYSPRVRVPYLAGLFLGLHKGQNCLALNVHSLPKLPRVQIPRHRGASVGGLGVDSANKP